MRKPRAFAAGDRRRDLARQRLVDDLALAHDQHPVARRRVDGAIQLRAMLGERHARRDVEHELLELREVRRERGRGPRRVRGRG